MRKYTAELLDQSGSPVVFLENANQIALQGFRLNQANSPAFIFPLNDDKASLLSMARRFKIYRNGEELYSGKINDRKADKAKGIMTIKGITQESELSRMITPDNWVYPPDSRVDTNEKDLADAVKYFLKDWEIYRKNTREDFAGYVEASDVDTTTDPGIIFLSTNQKTTTKKVGDPPTDTTFNYDQFVSNGYITFEFNLSSEVTEVERIRWKQVVGEAKDEGDNVQGTYITFQYCYSTNGGSTWSSWSSEAGKNAVSDYPENEGFPISITGLTPANDNRVRVKMLLYTENTTAEAYDWEDLDPATKNTLGITPELHGIEIICRKDGTVLNGNIPASTGIKVESFEISRDNHLNVIRQLCEEYDHEFMVRDDLTLDLSQEFGTFHADPFISGENCIITNLSDTLKIKNVIHCYGAGEGPDQRYTVVKDQASIDQYGEYPVIFEDTSIDNIDELKKAGQKELQGQPQQRFDIDIPYDSNTPFVALGDTITVLIPKENIEITGRVVEWSGGESGNGEIIKVSLDTPQSNIIDHIIKPKRLKKKTSGIQPPSQVRAKGGYGYAQVTWSGNADYYLVQTTQEPGDEDSWRNVGGKIIEKKYVITKVPVNTKIYFRVACVKDGQISLWSKVVSAKTTQLPYEDIQMPEPVKLDKPTGLSIDPGQTWSEHGVSIISNELTWNLVPGCMYNVQRDDGSGWKIGFSMVTPPLIDSIGLKPGYVYSYRIQAVNSNNIPSDWSDPVTVKTDSIVAVRNALPYNFLDSLDSNKPIELDFYIPTETVRIVSIKLTAKALPFRAYSKSAAYIVNDFFTGTGSVSYFDRMSLEFDSYGKTEANDTHHSHSTTYDKTTGIGEYYKDGEHTHSVTMTKKDYNTKTNSGTAVTVTEGSGWSSDTSHHHAINGYTGVAPHGHTHLYTTIENATITNSGKHSHSNIEYTDADARVGNESVSHRHKYDRLTGIENLNEHKHDLDITHNHSLDFGIYEDITPANVKLYCDDGGGYGSAISLNPAQSDRNPYVLAEELDLTNRFTIHDSNKDGKIDNPWKKIKLSSSRLGRINVMLIVKVDVKA